MHKVSKVLSPNLTLTFDHKINRGLPQVISNTFVIYHHCRSKAKGVIVQKLLFHRQTYSHGETSIPPPPNFVGGGYKHLCNVSVMAVALVDDLSNCLLSP